MDHPTDDSPREGGALPASGPSSGAEGDASDWMRALVEDSDQGLIVADGQARILYANEAAARLFGMSVEELVGRQGAEICRPEHLFAAGEVLGRVREAPREAVTTSLDMVRGDGGRVTLDARLVNHLATPGIHAILAYVHESSAPADALAESFQALFDQALIGMGVADMQGNLLAFNDAMLRPGGYTREDIERIGNVARLYADESDRTRVLQMLRAKGHVWRESVPFLRKDGSSYETRLTLAPVVFLERPCLYATVEEVTRGDEASGE